MGDYAAVNGVRMYYEVGGSGDPLVLVHGGFGGVHVWREQFPVFVERYRLFVPELRGRGHTPDVEGPISYQVMAEDMVGFLEQVVGGSAHVVGGSDGGIVALLVAMQRPELVRKVVTIGANFHRDGLIEGTMWFEAEADDEAWDAAREVYEAVSPNGAGHFGAVLAKLKRMWWEEPTLRADDLSIVSAPVLVMAGDDDVVSPAHTIALYEALPHGQLAVIPGASHAVFLEKARLVNQLILEFLDEQGPPQTIIPIRRAVSTDL